MKTKTYITELVIASGLLSLLSVGMFGAFGAVVHYLYTVVREESEYRFVDMFLFIILGFFVALVVDFFTQETFGRTYEGVLLLSGFLVLRILDFLDNSGLTILLNRAGIKVPNAPNKK